MDHTPGQGQYRDLEIWRRSIRSDHEVSAEEATAIAAEQRMAPKLSFEQLRYLADVAQECGVALASHDDDSVEHLDLMRKRPPDGRCGAYSGGETGPWKR